MRRAGQAEGFRVSESFFEMVRGASDALPMGLLIKASFAGTVRLAVRHSVAVGRADLWHAQVSNAV